MSIRPEGENLRNAVKWFSAERQADPAKPIHKLLDEACLTFNLTPAESAYLEQLTQGKKQAY
ncbi:MAG: hypothetical protein HKP58_05025 [Desulfatitalea sp.]|nr:hypothetical protein [Desulfatitalea sp.]NNJ99756.1 hypothetical protein [Desulfatitalea sp.]